jgi:hypothetical protein
VTVAFNVISTFHHDKQDLRTLLIRLALSNSTNSSKAVLQSLLALSSLHRSGHHQRTARLKEGALGALKTSAQCGLGDMEKIQHVATGMILSAFEVGF